MLSKREKELLDKIERLGFLDISTISGILKHKERITIKCNKGHLLESSISNLLRRQGCVRCDTVKSYYKTTETIKSYGFTVVSNEEQYIDNKSRINYICTEGHHQSHNSSYIERGFKCSECYRLKNFYRAVKILREEGLKVLSKESEIVNSRIKIRYICKRGHEYSNNIAHIIEGKRCKECQKIDLREARKLSMEEIKNTFEEDGYIILTNDIVYNNEDTILTVECPQGHVYDTAVGNFRRGYRCNRCAYEALTGSNNHLWKNGVSNLNNS